MGEYFGIGLIAIIWTALFVGGIIFIKGVLASQGKDEEEKK